LARCLHAAGAQLVLLLGWMHVLAPQFLQAGFAGVLNLHPAYLPQDPSADSVELPDGSSIPAFRGAHALRDALAAGVQTAGASLIKITSEVDRGPVLARRTLALQPGEDERSALSRLHAVERVVVREGILTWLAQRGLP
jgi:folate-dependent phosphoribosylglycinamide formyltransferase PurN